jgi:hypothetical protein
MGVISDNITHEIRPLSPSERPISFFGAIPQTQLTDRSPQAILASIPPGKMERIYYGLSVFRPSRPVNGVHYRTEKNTGVRFNGRKFYFNDSMKEREVVEILTEQSRNLSIDVIKNLRLTEEDFENIRVFDTENGFGHSLMIKGKSIQLSSSIIYLILNELNRHFIAQAAH